MASPQIFAFTVYDPSTGTPKTGAAGTMTFTVYRDETGANVTPPTIVEIGGGGYYFTPAFTTGHGIFFVITTGIVPAYVTGYLRPEDFNGDTLTAINANVTSLLNFQQGSWQIVTTGADAGKLVIYQPDGVTPLIKFALKHTDGSSWTAPTGANTTRTVTT
jgi:hypothetical protein